MAATPTGEFRGTDRFTVVRRLGAGGMGVVYEALDVKRGSHVALKTLTRADPDAIYQLKQEFRAIAGVAHPNLVTLYELHAGEGVWFITMELVEGRNFREHLTGIKSLSDSSSDSDSDAPTRTQPTTSPDSVHPVGGNGGAPERRAVPACDVVELRRTLRQLASGIAAIHSAGKLHRDLKPSNVLITTDGRVVILDFGIAADLRGDADTVDETHGSPAGTPQYMSPEQYGGIGQTTATDWYAMGVMMFEALTGQLPFAGGTVAALAHEKLTTDPARPSALSDGVPADLDQLCFDLMRRTPSHRPFGNDVVRRLTPAGGGESVAVSTAGVDRGGALIGRESTLASLRAAVAEAADGPVAVFLTAKSGMGKSTVLEAFLESAARDPRTVVLSGRCYEAESVPFKALDALMDSLARYLRRLPAAEIAAVLPRRADVLARMFPTLARVPAIADAPRARPGKDAVEERLVATLALRELLGRVTDRARLVAAIDDMQWGDLDSAMLLADVLAPPDAPAVALVMAARSENLATSACLTHLRLPSAPYRRVDLDLAPFTGEDVMRWHDELWPGDDPLPAERASRIAADAGGNPFLIREVLEAGGDTEARDETVAELIRAKVGSLDADGRRLMDVVSLSAKPLGLSQAVNAAGVTGEAQRLVTTLRNARLLRSAAADERETLETYHDRIRETVAAQIDRQARSHYHGRIVSVLKAAAPIDPEHVAFHLEGAGQADEAAGLYAQAAQQASAALAFDHAVMLYERAIRLRSAAADATLLARLAEALAEAGRSRDAAVRFAEAAQLADPAMRRELTRRAAYYFCISGRLDEGKAALGDVLRQFGIGLPQSVPAAIFAILTTRARLRLRGWRFRQRAAGELSATERERLDSLWAAAIGLGNTDVISGLGFSTRGLIQALDAGDPARIVRAMCWEACLRAVDDVKTAEKFLDEAERIIKTCETPYLRGMTRLGRGILTINQNRWRDAVAHFDGAEALWLEHCHGIDWELNTARHFCSWSLLYAGEFAEGRRRVAQYRREATERGNLYVLVSMGSFAEPLGMMAAGQPQAARARRQEVMATWTEQHFGVQHILAMLSEIQNFLYEGEGRKALEAARVEHAAAKKHGFDRLAVGRMTTDYLMLNSVFLTADREGPSDEILRDAHRAVKRLSKETQPQGAGHADAGRAGLALLKGNTAEAAAMLERADRTFSNLGMEAYSMSARLHRGRVIGGDRGQALVAEAEAWLREHGAASPHEYAQLVLNVPVVRRSS